MTRNLSYQRGIPTPASMTTLSLPGLPWKPRHGPETPPHNGVQGLRTIAGRRKCADCWHLDAFQGKPTRKQPPGAVPNSEWVDCLLCPLQKGMHMAVAQQTGIPKWVTLVSGNMDQNLRFAAPVENFEPHPNGHGSTRGLQPGYKPGPRGPLAPHQQQAECEESDPR